MKQKYQLSQFESDCLVGPSKVWVTKGAMITAKSDFNLSTQTQVLDFIGNGGLQSPKFRNSCVWDNNPNPDPLIFVDAYDFYADFNYGYIAFLYQPITGKWIVKSFKGNTELDPRNLPFRNLLYKLNAQ